MSKLNVIVKGFLRSGSSALQDMLLEYDSVGRVPGEFDYYRRPQLVGDHLQGWINEDYPSMMDEFIRKEEDKLQNLNFLIKYSLHNSLFRILPSQFFTKFNKLSTTDFNNRVNGRRTNLVHLKKLNELLETDTSLATKIEAANNWINQISQTFAPDSKITLFNHAIWEGHDYEIWTKVFEPFKIIFVYRDPRDQMSDIILDKHLYRFWNLKLSNLYGRDRNSAIQFNADILNKTLRRAEKICTQLGKDKAMMISFEDLVLNYEKSKATIEYFLGLNSFEHIKKYEFLNPGEAEKHIGIYKNTLSKTDLQQIEILTDWYHNKESEAVSF